MLYKKELAQSLESEGRDMMHSQWTKIFTQKNYHTLIKV